MERQVVAVSEQLQVSLRTPTAHLPVAYLTIPALRLLWRPMAASSTAPTRPITISRDTCSAIALLGNSLTLSTLGGTILQRSARITAPTQSSPRTITTASARTAATRLFVHLIAPPRIQAIQRLTSSRR